MKSLYLSVLVLGLISNISLFAQDTIRKNQKILYTLAYNEVSSHSKVPLVGFINIAQENHHGLQLGFFNLSHQNFKGLQIGFIDKIAGDMNGMQMSFLNFTSKNTKGLQVGFGNHSKANFSGLQIGFFNEIKANTKGVQLGFVNDTKDTLQGVQFGFVNVVDTIKGIPIGFFSYVKKGGYRAIEISTNELYPLNLSFKAGTPLFYSFVQGSFNPNYGNQFALGAGFGFLKPLKNKFYFNPEVIYQSSLQSDSPNSTALLLNFKYSLASKLQVSIGSSIVQLNYPNGDYQNPFFSLVNSKINDRNYLIIGARFAISYSFTYLYTDKLKQQLKK